MELKKLKKTFLLQLGQSDCGVACLRNLISFYGGECSFETLREISGTNTQGTTLLGLHQAAQKLGFNSAGCEADLQSIIQLAEPVILHVLIDNYLQHYIVFYGIEGDKFIIGDPAKGVVLYTKDELESIWLTKKCLTLKPGKSFVKANDIKTEKRKWLLRLIKDDYQLLLVSVALGSVIATLGLTMAIYSQKLVDTIIPAHNLNRLISSIAIIGILLLMRVFLIAVRQFLLTRQTKDFNNRIIDAFYSTLLYLPKSFFDTRKIGELVARLNDTGRIQKVINQIAGSIVIDGLVVLASMSFLFSYSWVLGVIALVSLPVYFFIVYQFNEKIIRGQKELMSDYAYSESNFINTIQGISIIKNFNSQALFAKANQLIYNRFQDKLYILGRLNIKLLIRSGVLSIIFLVMVLGYASVQAFNKELKLGELMAIISIAYNLIPSTTNIALVAIPVNEAKIAFERMFDFVSIPMEPKGFISEVTFDSLEIKQISFRFPGRKTILNNVSINVFKNEFISVVGESGSGKSTLGQILQKFYIPESGEIIVNKSFKLKDIDTVNWRSILGVVPQDIHLFNGNVLQNISIGNKDNNDERIIAFCNKYKFTQFIEKMPLGFYTNLGEEGINLSGGQKQIIGLARALYVQPQILFLDEATSALDRVTERFVLDLLAGLKNEMSIVFISHRLHLLKNISDRIYILENGYIKDHGSHDNLMLSSNLYSDYWRQLALS